VGKSTVAAALGQSLAQRGKRVLLVGLSAEDPYGRLFGAASIGTTPRELAPNFSAVNLDPHAVIDEFLEKKLKSVFVKVGRQLVGTRVFQFFYDAAPGLKELTCIGRVFGFLKEQEPGWFRHGLQWDAVILDAPATGHGLGLLGVPLVASRLMFGVMKEKTLGYDERLRDGAHTAICLVTIPEEMALNETLHFLGEARAKGFAGALAAVFLNKGYAGRFAGDGERLDPLGAAGEARTACAALIGEALARCEGAGAPPEEAFGADALDALLLGVRFDRLRQGMTARVRATLEGEGIPVAVLPFIHGRRFGQRSLALVARHVARALDAGAGAPAGARGTA
jgi:hypothetical protein